MTKTSDLTVKTDWIRFNLDQGLCPDCKDSVEILEPDDPEYDEHHNEVVCNCGFHYCITCDHLYD